MRQNNNLIKELHVTGTGGFLFKRSRCLGTGPLDRKILGWGGGVLLRLWEKPGSRDKSPAVFFSWWWGDQAQATGDLLVNYGTTDTFSSFLPSFLFLSFFLYMATLTAIRTYGSSQVRGKIGAAAAGLQPQQHQIQAKSTTYTAAHSSHFKHFHFKHFQVFDLHHSSQLYEILNALSRVRVQTCILMDTRWVLKLLCHSGNSPSVDFEL